ncbi:CBS domain-containing protein [Bradyrhizobium diazoefficiens]|nr:MULTISPECIES: CBS domain-containing protein [Bradyrhizobium]MBP1092660.1 CBS domain-containing protein [Bradyrhizobium japonicum]MBR0865112.1 CBS domain-containing protein [Bradyrhizobium diazoefficiens]MBR0889646.1 CBS domain-containing protein [Bradyrhizobium diazoefficiens]MBR0921353.1 CBS domain-containing protein [Bradyrhizobium diazoefficiens]WLA60931.1 CBS domain-containing protein [Bradyrhizobium diazoefficiens]
MKARDVMVSPVITAEENATVQDVAKTMVARRISAVPIVDKTGKLVGIVTEADLMHRIETETERRYSWWLHMLSGDGAMAADYAKSHARKIVDVMTREVKIAEPETPLAEIAELFETNGIKRVPIVDQAGDLVGIVSRANIIQAVASARPKLEIALSDATIRRKLMEELKKQPWAHSHKINVIVTRGIVDLWGTVESEQARKGINAVAINVPGVDVVNDHLIHEPVFVY